MRVVFMGTPDFAVPSLEALASAHQVSLVVTRPDAVRGRGKELVPSPVRRSAQTLGIPVVASSRITPEVMDAVRAASPDVIVVAAFGCILPDEVLSAAPLGCVNVHASLLPRWRGAAPVQRAVLAGDDVVGVSIMRVASELDAGPYCRQASIPVGDKGADDLLMGLARLGADELLVALEQMETGTACWQEQDEGLVTYATKVTKAEMRLDPADAAQANALRVQASTDAAPARIVVGGKGLRAVAARMATDPVPNEGEVAVEKGRVVLGCADSALELLRVRPDGKREMDVCAWAAGLRGSLLWGRA